jgi:hypothetical protein
MRLLLGSILIAVSILPAIVTSTGTKFREVFEFSWHYAVSQAHAAKPDRLEEPEQTREALREADQMLRALPLPDVIATLPAELTPQVDVPVEKVCDALTAAAQETGLPPAFFARLIWQESRFRQHAVSRAGAQGVAQFMPGTAAQFGLHNPFDPIASLAASARFLRDLFQQFGNIGLAAAAYNAGPRRIQEWLAQRGKMPDETRNYVKIITGQPVEKWTQRAPIDVAAHLPAKAPCEGVQGLSRFASADRIPVEMTPAIAKIIDEAKERVAKAKAAQLAKKEKANSARLAKLQKGKDEKTASKAGSKTAKVANGGAAAKSGKPNLKLASR